MVSTYCVLMLNHFSALDADGGGLRCHHVGFRYRLPSVLYPNRYFAFVPHRSSLLPEGLPKILLNRTFHQNRSLIGSASIEGDTLSIASGRDGPWLSGPDRH